MFQIARGTRVSRVSTPGSLTAGSWAATTAPRWRHAPTMSTSPTATTTWACSCGGPAHHRAPAPTSATPTTRAVRPDRTRSAAVTSTARMPVSTGADQPRTASHTTTAPTTRRSRVARPGREHPPETARRAHRDGVPGHVTAQDEAGEPAAAQHPDAGVPELVDEGDPEAQDAPQRVDRHGDEGRDEHHDHRDTPDRAMP